MIVTISVGIGEAVQLEYGAVVQRKDEKSGAVTISAMDG